MIAAERLLAATLVYMMLILAGDIETNPGPTLSDKPKMHELTLLKKADGTKPLDVIQWITAHEMWKCVDFANMLLREDVLVRKYQNDHKEKDDFVRIVFGDWLSRDDDKPNDSAVPCTWAALAECVSDAGLAGALSKAIRDTCQQSGSAPAVLPPSSASQPPPPPSSASQPPPLAVFPELQVCGYGAQLKNAPDPSSYWGLHDCKYKGEGTTLMLFDTGIDKSHQSFASKGDDKLWLPQYEQFQYPCYDEHGHGTMCAGIACGDELQFTYKDGEPAICRGVAPGAKLGIWKAYRINGESGDWTDQLNTLIDHLVKYKASIDVLVIPGGFYNPNHVLHDHIKTLDSMGIIVVCASSNDGAVNSNTITYPARYQETICVGSNSRDGKECPFSPVGEEMDCFALGDQVIGPKCKSVVINSGTSFAAAALGGLICLIIQVLKSCQALPAGVKPDRRFIVPLLKLLTNNKGHAIDSDRLKDFFGNPKHFIDQLIYLYEGEDLDGEYYSAKLESMMKKGKPISMSIIQCMPFGPPRIGKTCVRDRLAGRKVKGERAKKDGNKIVYPRSENISKSTGAAEKVERMFVERSSSETLQKQEDKWVHCDYHDEVISVVKGIDRMYSTTVEEPNPSNNDDFMPTTHVQDMPTESVQPDTKLNTRTPSEKQSTFNVHHRQQQHDVPVSTGPGIKRKTIENFHPTQPIIDAFQLKKSRNINALLENQLTIYFTDTGGQPEFQEIIPMLVAGPSLFLLVFSLAKSLDHTYVVEYNTVDEDLEPYTSSFTVLSVMLQCLASIACISTKRQDKDGNNKFIQSKVLFIGTQYDLLSDSDTDRAAQLDQIDKQLQGAIVGEGLNNLVQPRTANKYIFAVNNYDESDDSFKIIRKTISDVSEYEEMYKVKLPVSFVLLDFCLRQPIELEKQVCQGVLREHGLDIEIFESFLKDVMKTDMVNVCDPKRLTEAVEVCKEQIPSKTDRPKYLALTKLNQLSCRGNPVMTMEQFKAIAERCGITSEDVETALWTLHHLLGTIRYYPQVPALKDTVITDQQFFFDIPTKLITSTFSVNRTRSIIPSKSCKTFYNDGIFTKKDLEKVWEQEITQLTSDQLVALLEHLHILARLSDAGEPSYFLPCVLRHAPLHDKQQSSTHNSIATPLLLTFACGFTPNGMFSSLLSFFLQHSRGKFGLYLDFCKNCLFRDQASFYVEPLSMYLTLTIKSMPEYISFSLHQDRVVNVTSGICATVKKFIEEGLKEVASRLNYNTSSILYTDSKFGFECKCDDSKPAHFAKCESPSCSPIKCSLTGCRCEVPSDFTQWFHEAALAEPPSQPAAAVTSDAHEYGSQNSNVLDPSSYWELHKCCKYKGEGTTLMVFDTGIDKTHPSFASRINNTRLWLPQEQSREQFTCDDKHEHGHGTICAGIACGDKYTITDKDDNKFTCRGVAPEAKLGIWKTSIQESEKEEWKTELEKLTEYMCTESNKQKPPVDVLVISSGYTDRKIVPRWCFEKLKELGIIVVCAGSNDGDTKLENIAYPALYPETICVGSHKHQGRPSDFSPVGAEMDFLAPGEHIVGPKSKTCIISKKQGLSKESHKYFRIYKGTSFAAPALGGLICLILQALRESYCPEVPLHNKCHFIKQVLISLTNQKSESKVNNDIGYGVIAKDCLEKFFPKELKDD